MISTMQMKSKPLLNDPLVSTTATTATTASKCCKTDFDKVFDQSCFLEQLRLEKHRAQRSKTALSIVLLTQDKPKSEGLTGISEMLKFVRTITRETDVVGYIDKYTLGVLLPYTDEIGAQRIGEKIVNSYINPQLAIVASTYPDQIFDSLAKNGCVSSDVLKLMLEDSIAPGSLYKLQIKRAIDVIGSLIALSILSPVMLVAAALVKFNSPGPVIFKQTRLGKKGIPFTFYKFRSMRTDTNDQIHRDYVIKLINGDDDITINNGDVQNPLYKINYDPRVTSVGSVIRKTSIDELPQLYNVLKGDMSLVGPRPPLGYEAEKYQSWHLRRILEMKPGITGLWQVEGRSRTGFDEAVRLDVRYLQTWSLMLDIKILFRTIKEVLQCRGAV
ncbi:sugar transferase [Methyloglobulus sp.]|uniref:sugar transferase n=1 Tax=Methyloglobulus sp. TaxID=2518622 RepID=UPI0032B814CE